MPAPAGDRLLLLGASARALARSALRSRHARRLFPGGLVGLDFFGDADLDGEPIEVIAVARDAGLARSVANLGRHALTLDWQGFLVAGGLENRPGLMRMLERRGRPLGCRAAAVRAVRDPERLAGWLASERLPHAPVVASRRAPTDGGLCMLKPRRGAGGGGVRVARPGEPAPPGWYLQEHQAGRAGSAAFLADGRAARLIGVSEQLVGWGALGGSGFRHAGNLFDAAAPCAGPEGLLDEAGIDAAGRIATGLAARFGLSGLVGFDFIAVDGSPRLIEVNPRWTASMELYDDARPGSLLDAQFLVAEGAPAELALQGDPSDPIDGGLWRCDPTGGAGAIRGRAVLYATGPIAAPPPAALAAIGARDRPRAGEAIDTGSPICTLHAVAATAAGTRAALEAAAAHARALCRSRRVATA